MEQEDDGSGLISLENNSAQLRSIFDRGRGVATHSDRVSIDRADGEGFLEFLEVTPDFNMIISQCTWDDDRLLTYRGEGWVRMNFCIDASATFVFDKTDRFDLFGSECRIFHQPEGVDCAHFIKRDSQSLCVTLSAKRGYFTDELGLETEGVGEGFAGFLEGRHDDFFFERLPLTRSMARAVNDMVTSPYSRQLRRLHLAAKAHELVCDAWEAASRNEMVDVVPLRFSDRHRRQVQQAREILDSQLDGAPPTAKLARMVGLNRNQLAYGFRKLYGSTVYEYHLDRRMNAAWRLLADGDMSVAEVSWAVGYKHQASFSVAFRGHFGVAPKEVRPGQRPVAGRAAIE